MPTFSLMFALPALAFVLVVFFVVNRLRGLRFALVAGVLTCVAMFALFVATVTLITAAM